MRHRPCSAHVSLRPFRSVTFPPATSANAYRPGRQLLYSTIAVVRCLCRALRPREILPCTARECTHGNHSCGEVQRHHAGCVCPDRVSTARRHADRHERARHQLVLHRRSRSQGPAWQSDFTFSIRNGEWDQSYHCRIPDRTQSTRLLLRALAAVNTRVRRPSPGWSAPANSTCNITPSSVALGSTTTISVTVLTGVSSTVRRTRGRGRIERIWSGLLRCCP